MFANGRAIAGGLLALTTLLGQAACSGGEAAGGDSGLELSTAGASVALASAPVEYGVTATAIADTITPAMIAQGKRVFEGEGGAICMTCHGKDAKGVKGIGPDLTDGKWIHGDGSFEFLKRIVKDGVMQPKETPSVMPPYGGIPLNEERLAAVAAYVFSLKKD